MNTKSIQKTVFKVADFISWQKIGSLELSPAFQRRPVWPVGAKSLLIDTVLRGIPMPIIFVRERSDLSTLEPIRQIVDGQQRLRTLIAFIDASLLKDFNPSRDDFEIAKQHSKHLPGRTFNTLDNQSKRAILDYEFSVHVLPSDTEDREVLQIFARMNSTGYKLNDQELRNAEFFGDFKSVMYDLAYEQLPRWREWRVFSETDIARMIEVEETSDIVITMLNGVHGKNRRLLDGAYRNFNDAFPQRAEVVSRFRAVMDAIEDTIGEEMPRLAFRRKALFNTLATFYYSQMYGLKSKLVHSRPRPVKKAVREAVISGSEAIERGELSERLRTVLRGATAHLESRKLRLQFLQDLL
jgi:hypothetical protein